MLAYADKLRELVDAGLFCEKGMQDPRWAELSSLINEDVLVRCHGSVRLLCWEAAGKIPCVERPAKKMQRVLKKLQKGTPDVHFKCCSDLAAVRIPCGVYNLQTTVDMLKEKNHSKYFFQRNSIKSLEDRHGVNDIVTFLYYCDYDLGIIMEIQLGEPFAFYTFQLDSFNRDFPDPEKRVSLWDFSLYENVKEYLLGRSPGFNYGEAVIYWLNHHNAERKALASLSVNLILELIDQRLFALPA